MKDGNPGIRALDRGETEQLVAVYRRAFWDDPVIEFLAPDEKSRGRALDAYMRMAVRYALRKGIVQAIPGGQNGLRVGATWLPPEGVSTGMIDLIRAGFLSFLLANRGNLRKFFAFSQMIEKMHKEDIPKEHMYLWVLATDPPEQGKGWGSAVIQPELADADRRGLPCYLETTKPRNLPFYERAGFVVKREVAVPGGGPPLWTMIREPMR